MTVLFYNCRISVFPLLLTVVIFSKCCSNVVSADNTCQPTDNIRNNNGDCVINIPNVTSIEIDDESYICPIWNYKNGWVLSGRTIPRNGKVTGLFPDLMIPWKQHSARAFLRWGRHHYFFHNPTAMTNDSSEFIFAPGYTYPLECHSLFSNLAVNYSDVFIDSFGDKPSDSIALNPPIRTDRAIAIADPLYLPCIDTTLSARKTYESYPPVGLTNDDLDDKGEDCLDMQGIYVKEVESSTNIDGSKYYGTFASRNIGKGYYISWGPFLPIHKLELHDPITNKDELLLNYCYSPNRNGYTSSLLLLPMAPGVNAINHADRNKHQEPNVAVMWMEPKFDPDKFFVQPTDILFGNAEKENDVPRLMVEYVALRDINAGEELLIDYGDAWQEAMEEYEMKQQNGITSEFRHPIGLPDDMIPLSWLKKESIFDKLSYREWLLPKLDVGELKPIELSVAADETNEVNIKHSRQIKGQVDRIGLPEGLSEYMAKWANEIGITEVLRAHVRGELQLPPEGERRLRLNGTTWWVKRFPVDWRSDMHYISPDDFESNQMFMNALADAGFDTVIKSVGIRDNLTSITVYYPSYIAVSHCTNTLMHNDSEEDGHYNVIFPVVQVNNSKPELIVGDDSQDLYAPYKYEPDHAVVLGKSGLHGTAPCDYRGTDSMRMVVSAYMLDGDSIPTRDKVIKDWIESDPPYPRIPDRVKFIESTKHWKRDDPTRSLRSPLLQPDSLTVEDK
jgi:hypothetical protein